MPIYYLYGMIERGFSPGCQPEDGLVIALPGGKYGPMYIDVNGVPRRQSLYNRLVYNRPLTFAEQAEYELVELGQVNKAYVDGGIRVSQMIPL